MQATRLAWNTLIPVIYIYFHVVPSLCCCSLHSRRYLTMWITCFFPITFVTVINEGCVYRFRFIQKPNDHPDTHCWSFDIITVRKGFIGLCVRIQTLDAVRNVIYLRLRHIEARRWFTWNSPIDWIRSILAFISTILASSILFTLN